MRLSIFTAFKQLLEAVPTEDWFCEGSKLKQKERNQEKLEALTKSRTVSSSGQVQWNNTRNDAHCYNHHSGYLGRISEPGF